MKKIAPQYGVVTEFRDVEELCLNWQVEAPAGGLPPYEEIALGSLGRLADDLALAARERDGSYQFLYGGDAFEAWLGRVAARLCGSTRSRAITRDALRDALEAGAPARDAGRDRVALAFATDWCGPARSSPFRSRAAGAARCS